MDIEVMKTVVRDKVNCRGTRFFFFLINWGTESFRVPSILTLNIIIYIFLNNIVWFFFSLL